MSRRTYRPTWADYRVVIGELLPTLLFAVVVSGFALVFMILVGTGR